MLNRDFTKSKREYLKKNRALLIVLAVFLVVGIVVTAILGFNATPDFTGGHVVDIHLTEDISNKELDKYEQKINSVLAENNLSLYSVQLKGEGDYSVLEVKYTGKVTESKIDKVNAGFEKELDNIVNEFEHLEFSGVVSSSDYIYAIMAGLIILVLASIFVMARHNIAYAISMLGAGAFSVVGLMCVFGLLRLEISMSFFFILTASLVYTIYESLILFEKMRDVASIPENKNDKSAHIVQGMKNNANRLQYTSLGLFFLGFVFVVFGTTLSRAIALGFMFAVVLTLLSISIVLPFIYNLTIEKVTVKTRKVKAEKVEPAKEVKNATKKEEVEVKTEVEKTENTEEVVEERFTQEPVDVEVLDTKADTTNLEE